MKNRIGTQMINRRTITKVIIGLCCILCGCTDLEVDRAPNVNDVRALCDGSDDLVLVLRFDPLNSNTHPISTFFADNGSTFIHLNGKCEYWTYGDDTTFRNTTGLPSRTIRSATLTDDQAIVLLSKLKFLSWPNFDGEVGGANGDFDGDTFVFIESRRATFRYSAGAVDDRRSESDRLLDDITHGSSSASEYLFNLGTPIPKGDMRVYISDEHPESFWSYASNATYVFDWPVDSITVDDLVKQQNRYCKGRSFLVTGDAAKEIWDQREAFLKVADETTGIVTLGVRDETRTQAIYIRDAVPGENELGLVEFGGRLSETCNF